MMIKKIFLCIVLIAVIGFSFWKIYSESSPEIIPVELSKSDFPLIEIEIDGKKYILELALCSKYPFFMHDGMMDKLSKVRKGKGEWREFNGSINSSDLYELSNVQLGKLKLTKTLTAFQNPLSEEWQGSIRWPFDKKNLLLDFPRRQVCGIKKNKDLAALGIDLKKMEKVKCRIKEGRIYFDMETPLGKLNMLLQTTCTRNVVGEWIWNDEKEVCLNTNIKIGNKDFGKCRLVSLEITPELKADGILGMEFLKEHIVFIDAAEECFYIGEKYPNTLLKSPLEKIPVEFTYNQLPVIEIEVLNQKHKMIVDLGASSELTLLNNHFPQDKLRYIYPSNCMNFIGDEYEVKRYVLPECKVGSTILKNLILNNEANEIGVTTNVVGKKNGTLSREGLGTLGSCILHRANILFDFPHFSLWLIQQSNDLKKVGFDLEQCVQIPFDLDKGWIVVKISGDFGNLRFFVDTGSSGTFCKGEFLQNKSLEKDSLNNSYYFSEAFILGDCNFGNKKVFPFEITSKIENIDGILGMDFLKEHVFYIDFQKRIMYIQKPD